MSFLKSLSIRSTLFLVTIVVVLPAAGIIIFSGLQFRNVMFDDARKETIKLADRIVTEQKNLVVGAEQLMMALAQLPDVKHHEPTKVEPVLRKILKLNPMYSNIFISDRNGAVWASAVPVQQPFIIADRRYFKNALAGDRLSSGEYVVSRATTKPALNFAYPIRNDQGTVVGVISVGLVIDRYKQLLEKLQLKKGTSFVFSDHRGIVLYRAINPESFVGKPYPRNEFLAMIDAPDGDTRIRKGVAGDERIITCRKIILNGEKAPYMYVTVGVPVDVALKEANEALVKNMVLLASCLLAACIISFFIGNYSITKRIGALEKASEALANGNMKSTISEHITGGELGRLALTFDNMSRQLALREKSLIESQERLRSFISNAPVILFVLDKNGTLTFSEGKGLESLWLNHGQVVGQSAFELYKEYPSALDGIQRALSGENFSIETTIGDKAFEVRYSPIKTDSGEINGSIGVATDITERKQAEKAAEEKENKYRVLIESANDGIFVFGETGLIDCNQRGADMYGLPKERLLGRSPEDFTPERQPNGRLSSEMAGEMARLAISGRPQVFEWQYLRADGVPFDVEITLNSLQYEGEVCLLAILRDIRERKQAEEERDNLKNQLLHAQKLESLGVLAGGIAHDFNNILMVILGNADLALMRINKESPAVDNLHKIEQASARAADLAKQMLAYSGRGKFIVENIDLNQLLEDMLHMLEVSISKKVVLRFNLHNPLPAVEADITQMRQIIMNLVINASEAIGDISGVIAITTGCMDYDKNYLKNVWLNENIREGLYVYLEIADSGCGMDKETLTKIFDPFFTTKFTGRGLGMAAVLGIVRGHKGAIKVYSEIKKGTTFKILLPASDKPLKIFNNNIITDNWIGTGKVLLVDDEETVRGIGAEMLKELGFEVITAEDGRQALELYKNNTDIQFVLLDLTMPHMDGEQCFRELKQMIPEVKVIMSSGFSEQEVTQKFVGNGLAGYIQKPYKLSMLKDVIRAIKQV